jgi:hypothetical protein
MAVLTIYKPEESRPSGFIHRRIGKSSNREPGIKKPNRDGNPEEYDKWFQKKMKEIARKKKDES